MTTVAHDNVRPTGADTAIAPPAGTPVPGGKLGVPHRPQVNLLPPEVTNRRQVGSAKRRMRWSIIATIVLIIVAFGGAWLIRAESGLAKEAAQATSEDLLRQRQEFSPVIEVMNNIDKTRVVRNFVLTNEVDWTKYVSALAAVLPDDVTIDTLSVLATSAGEELVAGSDPLTTNAIGVMTFAAESPTLPVASEWIDAIESIHGLADVNLRSSELTDSEGETTYAVTATVQVTIDARAQRVFSDEPVEEESAEAADVAPEAGE